MVARACILEIQPERKLAGSEQIHAAWQAGILHYDDSDAVLPIEHPGFPPNLNLVSPLDVPRRKMTTRLGRAALLHALAHIEYNAINLAWDAVYRFRGLPRAYYDDWIRVACEEASHFALLRARLRVLDYDYGDFPAHNGLWEMALKTAGSALERMALVPRVLEARGLDVTPGLIARLRKVGDQDSAACLDVILRDEIGHVAVGTYWFRYLCAEAGLHPDITFADLLRHYTVRLNGRLQGPFHHAARIQAGFTAAELAMLADLTAIAPRASADPA